MGEVVALSPSPPSAAEQQAHAIIRPLLESFWKALDDGDMDAARKLTADDIILIDAFPPHRWSGPDAFDRWIGDLARYSSRQAIIRSQTTLRATSRFIIGDKAAYIVVPAIMTADRDTDLMTQQGVITMAMRETAEGWRVAGMSWAGQ